MTMPNAPARNTGQIKHGQVIVHVFGRTDVGRNREHNEDAFTVADLTANKATLQADVRTHVCGERGSIFMVADGMGGAAAGEIASQMAVDTVIREMQNNWLTAEATDGETFARAIRRATATTNAEIHTFAVQHPEYRGMGTTATIAGLLGDTLYVAQVGDSRAYLVRDGVARQITKDQSLMQKLVEAGEMTEEEAEQSERRNIILQALGPETSVKVDLTHQAVRRGDVLVLCSDGLSGQVSKDEIAQIVGSEKDLPDACKQLIDRANDTGGPDNITVVLARFEGEGLPAAHEDDKVGHQTFPINDTGAVPVIDRAAVTAETPASRPTVEVASPPAGMPPSESVATPVPAQPESRDSRARRVGGKLIAFLLLLVLIAAAAWFVGGKARQLAPRGDPPGAPAERQ
jgi:PPM family protein phosphatase